MHTVESLHLLRKTITGEDSQLNADMVNVCTHEGRGAGIDVLSKCKWSQTCTVYSKCDATIVKNLHLLSNTSTEKDSELNAGHVEAL